MNIQEDNKRYVAHFDILGFKSATLRNPDEAWGALSDLRGCMDKALGTAISISSLNQKISDRIMAYIFSDTVLIFTLSDTLADFAAMLTLNSHFFADALVKRIPLRGGIAYGDFFYNPHLHLFCGIPFVNAYALGEEAQWSGIIVDDAVAEHYATKYNTLNLTSDGKPVIVQYDVPMKSNEIKRSWVINWPIIFMPRFTKRPPISLNDYYAAFESLFGPYDNLCQSVKAKYENTVNFINSSLT